MDVQLKATPGIVKDYADLFVNRRAYTLQSVKPHPETGRHYYFRPKREGTNEPVMLTAEWRRPTDNSSGRLCWTLVRFGRTQAPLSSEVSC